MKKIGGILRFLKAVIFVLNYAIATYIVNIFGNGEKFLKQRTGSGAKKLMDITGASITVSGTENIDTNKHYIFVGNHRSYTDILVIFAAGGIAGCHFTFMAKKELFRIPFLGKAMQFLHVISVERGSTSKAMKSLLEAIEVIKTGNPIGDVRVIARVTDRVIRGFIGLHQGCWYDPDPDDGIDDGGCANTLMAQRPSRVDHGNGQQSAMVWIKNK